MSNEQLLVEVRGDNLLAVTFNAMASPCEVLLPLMDHDTALAIGTVAAQEAWRIERKYSRYCNDSVTAWIHGNRGVTVSVDPETSSLIDFAKQCFDISDGLFDITSGVLRGAWTFDGSSRIPEAPPSGACFRRWDSRNFGGNHHNSCCLPTWNWTSVESAKNMPSIAPMTW